MVYFNCRRRILAQRSCLVILPLYGHLYTEASAEFALHLEDEEVEENESATFTCQLSKPNRRVSWMKNGQDLKENGEYHVTSDGNEHSMTISKVKLEDAAEYTVRCGDLESKARLCVKGTLLKTCTVIHNVDLLDIVLYSLSFAPYYFNVYTCVFSRSKSQYYRIFN